MGSPRTIRRLNRTIDRLFRILGPLADPHKPASWDSKTGKMISVRKGKPGLLELVYREIPQTTRAQFMTLTEEPMPEPTEKELRAFEHLFMVTARRVLHRELSRRLGKAPHKPKRGRGRYSREEKPATVRMIQQEVKKYEKSEGSKTKGVEKAASVLGKHVDTIWRYLRAAKHPTR